VFEGRAAEALLLRDWRDNLRGVDRLVHALAGRDIRADADEPLTFGALPPWLWEKTATGTHQVPPAEPPAPETSRAAPTREQLAETLARNHGSIRATARFYGRDRKQIYRWMDAMGLREKTPER